MLLKASDFGLPQRRTRLFVLAVNKARAIAELSCSPEDVLESVVKTFLPTLKVKCPSVDTFFARKRCHCSSIIFV